MPQMPQLQMKKHNHGGVVSCVPLSLPEGLPVGPSTGAEKTVALQLAPFGSGSGGAHQVSRPNFTRIDSDRRIDFMRFFGCVDLGDVCCSRSTNIYQGNIDMLCDSV